MGDDAVSMTNALAHIAGLKFNDVQETETGAVVGPGFAMATPEAALEIKNGFATFRGDELVRIFGAFDEACLEAMARTHAELFPKSESLPLEEIEDMFKPLVKRAGLVRVALADDVLVEDHEGNAVDLSEVDDRHCTTLVEFCGFEVQADGFTPIVSVAEVLVSPPKPAPKRTSRLKKQLAAAAATPPAALADRPPKRSVRIVDEAAVP